MKYMVARKNGQFILATNSISEASELACNLSIASGDIIVEERDGSGKVVYAHLYENGRCTTVGVGKLWEETGELDPPPMRRRYPARFVLWRLTRNNRLYQLTLTTGRYQWEQNVPVDGPPLWAEVDDSETKALDRQMVQEFGQMVQEFGLGRPATEIDQYLSSR